MPEIRRLFVEKQPPFAVEARKLHQDLRDHLDLAGLEGVRLVVRYDVEGLDGAGLEAARWTVFAEPPVDLVFEEELPLGPGETALAWLTRLGRARPDRAEALAGLARETDAVAYGGKAATSLARLARAEARAWKDGDPGRA